MMDRQDIAASHEYLADGAEGEGMLHGIMTLKIEITDRTFLTISTS
jgi:hypothetical protein